MHIVNFTLPGGAARLAPMLSEVAAAAEDVGVSHISVMDHFFQLDMLGSGELDMLEAYTVMGFLAARTRTIETTSPPLPGETRQVARRSRGARAAVDRGEHKVDIDLHYRQFRET